MLSEHCLVPCIPRCCDAFWPACRKVLVSGNTVPTFSPADFSGEQVVQRHMTRLGRESLYTKIESATVAGSRTDLELVLQDYGKAFLLFTIRARYPCVVCT